MRARISAVAIAFVCLIGFGCNNSETSPGVRRKWFPFQKGGVFRRWYGNNHYLINWAKEGFGNYFQGHRV